MQSDIATEPDGHIDADGSDNEGEHRPRTPSVVQVDGPRRCGEQQLVDDGEPEQLGELRAAQLRFLDPAEPGGGGAHGGEHHPEHGERAEQATAPPGQEGRVRFAAAPPGVHHHSVGVAGGRPASRELGRSTARWGSVLLVRVVILCVQDPIGIWHEYGRYFIYNFGSI